MKKQFLLFIALLFVTLFSWGQTYRYVPGTYATIQAAIDAATPGDIIQVAAGTYHETYASWADINVYKSLTIIGAGSGSTRVELRKSSTNGIYLGASNITLQGFTFTKESAQTSGPGNNIRSSGGYDHITLIDVESSYSGDMNVVFDGAVTYNYLTLTNCNFHHSLQQRMFYESPSTTINYLTITNCHFDYAGYETPTSGEGKVGMQLQGFTNNLVINGATFNECPAVGLDLMRVTGATINDITINHSGYSGSGKAGLRIQEGYQLPNPVTSNIHINNPTLTNCGGSGARSILFQTISNSSSAISNITITGGSISSPNGIGIYVYPWPTPDYGVGGPISGITVDGVTFPAGSNNYAIYIAGSKNGSLIYPINNVNILNNIVNSGSGNGIYAGLINTLTVNNNTVTSRTTGITLLSSTGVTANGNNVQNNSISGITINGTQSGSNTYGSSNVVLNNNIISNNPGILGGLNIGDYNTTVSAQNNVIESNKYGVLVSGTNTSGVVVSGNSLAGNTSYGLQNTSANQVTATCNWWGTNDPATIAGMIQGSVTYDPYKYRINGLCPPPTPITTIGTPTYVSCGVYDVDVKVSNFTEVGAISLVLNFDPLVFAYRPTGVTLNAAISEADANVSIPGKFSLGYFPSGITLDPDAVLFTLHFTLLPGVHGPTNLTWSTGSACEYAGLGGVPTYVSSFVNKTWTIDTRPVKNTTTLREYCTIQAAIDDPLTLNGHTITVAAGTYAENVIVTKTLTLLGSKAGVDPRSVSAGGPGSRNHTVPGIGETVIIPGTTDMGAGNILTIRANGVVIDGIWLDGSNVNGANSSLIPGTGKMVGGTEVFAIHGVANGNDNTSDYASVTGLVVRNSIIRNFADWGLGVFNNYTGISYNNTFTRCFVDNLNGPGIYGPPIAIFQGYSAYASVIENEVINSVLGIYTENNHTTATGLVPPVIQGNDVSATRASIWHNSSGSVAPTYTISNNMIRTWDPGAGHAGQYNVGLWITTIMGNVQVNVSNNTITAGAFNGIQLTWNTNNAGITIHGGSVTGVRNIGMLLYNNATTNGGTTPWLGGWGGCSSPCVATLDGVTFTNCPIGVKVWDNLNAGSLTLGFINSVSITGGTEGLVADGPHAHFGSLDNTILTGQSGNYIELINNPYNIDATAVSFDSHTGATADLAQNFAIEDKIVHKIDNSALGFVLVKASNDYVTVNSFILPATSTPSIQRGIDAAGTPGWTVNVGPGNFNCSMDISKSITVLGQGTGVTNADRSADATAGNVVYIHGACGNVKVDGFTIKTGIASTTACNGVSIYGLTAPGTITISNNAIWGNPLAVKDNLCLIAGYFSITTPKLVFDHNTLHGGWSSSGVSNPILVERWMGPTEITNNTIDYGTIDGTASDVIVYMNYDYGNITEKQLISGNTLNMGWGTTYDASHRGAGITLWSGYNGGTLPGGYTNIEISGNSLFNLKPSRRGISLYNSSDGDGSGGNFAGAVISGNTVSNASGYSGEFGIRVRGKATGTIITNNLISGVSDAVLIAPQSGHQPVSTSVNNNSLLSTTGYSINNTTSATIAGTCNWFGTNTVSGVAAKISGPVTYAPWLVDGSDIGDPGFVPGGTCTGATELFVNDGVFDGNDIYTHGIGNDANPGTADAPFLTIGKAVSVAMVGTTIKVDAGTFQEQVMIGKTLNIIGVDSIKTIVKSPVAGSLTTVAWNNASPVIYASGTGNTVNISKLAIDGDGGRSVDEFVGMLYYEANGTFDQNKITGIHDVGGFSGMQRGHAFYGVYLDASAQSLTITHNLLMDYQKGGIYVDGAGANTNVLIDGNVVKGQGIANIIGQNGISPYQCNVTITNNLVSNNIWNKVEHPHQWTASGIMPYQTLTTNISGNTLNGNEIGLMGYLVGSPTYGINTFNNNKIHVWLDNASQINAGNIYDKTVLNPAKAEVVFGCIQYAIDEASSGNTLNASAGTFVENVVVHTPVTINGNGMANTKVIPAFSAPNPGTCSGASLCPDASNIFLVQASDVSIQNLTVNGDNPALTGGIVINGAKIDARNGIITDHLNFPTSVFNNLNINNVTIKNIYLRGIYASTGGTFNIHDNTVSNVWGDPNGSIAIFNYGGGGAFTNNHVDLANDGISSNHSNGTTYSGNTVSNSGNGIHTDNQGDGGGTADVITGNNVNTSPWGILVFVPYKNVQVQNNNVTGCDVGLASVGQYVPALVTFNGNTVDGNHKVNSTGIYTATTTWYWASGSSNHLFTNNFIKNNDWAFDIESESGFTNTTTVHDNSVTGNTNGVYLLSGGTLNTNMTCNWWGATSAAAVASAVGASNPPVNYTPWLINGFDNSGDPGFQPVPLSCGGTPVVVTLNSKTDVKCNGDANGAIDINVAGGLAQFTYFWTPGGFLTEDRSGLVARDYTVLVTDANGSTGTISVTITEPQEALSAYIMSSTDNVCHGGNTGVAHVDAFGGTEPYSYLWNDPLHQATVQANDLIAGVYMVTVTDANLCTTTVSVTIKEPDAIAVGTSSKTDVLCFGGNTGSITLGTVSGGAPLYYPYVYLWTTTDGSIPLGQESQPNLTGLTIGTYTYSVSDGNGCPPATGSITINQPAQGLLASIDVWSDVPCHGGSDGYARVFASGGTGQYSYLWNDPLHQTTDQGNNLAAGDYIVTVTDANLCTTTASVTINEPDALITVGPSSKTDLLCFGASNGAITLGTVSGGNAPYVYLWTTTDGSIPSGQEILPNLTGLTAGTYNYSVTNLYGCPPVTGSITINVVDIIAPEISCPANVTVNQHDSKDPYSTGYATATDCSAPVTVTYDDDRSGLNLCNATGVIVRTWTAKDRYNNTSNCKQTINVQDEDYPIAICPEDITVNNDPNGCTAVVNFSPTATDFGYFQGFENTAWLSGNYANNPSTDWNDYSSAITRVTSGTDGINSKSGSAHAVINSTANIPANSTGAFCRLGGYNGTFGAGFISSVDVYFNMSDLSLASGTYGWDLDQSVCDNTGGFLRDFVYHVAGDNTGIYICVSNGSSDGIPGMTPTEIQAQPHASIPSGTQSGWYTMKWETRNNAGFLAVDFTITNGSGTIVWTNTITGADAIATVGGNRYMWFNFIAADKLAIDNTTLTRKIGVVAVPPSGTAFAVGTTPVTVTTTDACGKTATCSFNVTVNDNVHPTLNCPATISVQCVEPSPYANFAAFTAAGGTASDNCGVDEASFAFVADVKSNETCAHKYTITRTYKIKDVHGNWGTCDQTILVNDITAPVIAAAPADVSVQCIGNVPAMTNLTWTDNCSAGGSVSGHDGALVGTSCGGTITRTWNVSDDCGNPAITRTQIITIHYTAGLTAPPNGSSTVSGPVQAVDPGAPADITDACGRTVHAALVGHSLIPACAGTVVWTYRYTACDGTTTADWTYTYTVIESTISGYMNYYNLANTLLAGPEYKLELYRTSDNNKMGTTSPDGYGYYQFTGLCPDNYYIIGTSTHPTAGSVNTTDAAQVNYWPSAPYSIEKVRFHAGDVNRDLFLSATDALRIQKHFVYGEALFPFGTTWTFWKAGYTISHNPICGGSTPEPECSESYPNVTLSGNLTVNMYGLCTGDFNRSFDPSIAKMASATLDLIYTGNRQVGSNQEFDLPVRVMNPSTVGAVSLIMNFPADMVEVQNVTMNGTGGQLDWAVNGNELRIGWNSMNPLELGSATSLLTLHLKTTAAFVTGNSIRFSLAGNPLNELANGEYNVINDAVLGMDVIEAAATGINNQPAANNLTLGNHPNPFNSSTIITWSLPFEGKVTLEIRDLLGKVVKVLVNETQTAGDHSLRFDSDLGSGIYTATIRVSGGNDELVRTIKLVSNK